MAKSFGRTPRTRSEYIAGKSMRLNKSPLAPKKTILHASAIRSLCSPERSGFEAACAPSVVTVATASVTESLISGTCRQCVVDRGNECAQPGRYRALEMDAYAAPV